MMQYLRRGGAIQDMILTNRPSALTMPPLELGKVAPCLRLSERIFAFLKDNPKEFLRFDHPVLHGSSTDFRGFPGQDRVWGKPNVACAAIEHLILSEHGRKIAKNYDMFIAISKWNEDYLKSLNVGPVYLCYQGIDPTLFHPAAGTGLFRDRFVIFSGGKLEYRKGQDIVIAAFKRFREKHPEALLITCWQALVVPEAEAFAQAGHVDGVPQERPDKFGLQITPWLMKQGLPEDSFVDLPFTHNLLMPSVFHECDMAVFPNRCEGGTNLVAMEAMACGVPTYVAYNTGQKDLVDRIGCKEFRDQKAVKATPSMLTVEGWGETEVDELVAAMDRVYTRREESQKEAAQIAEKMKDWTWGELNEKLLKIVFGESISG